MKVAARGTPRAKDDGQGRIGESARVRGRVVGGGDLTVAGTIDGDVILSSGQLSIEEGGSITASQVEAGNVRVAGAVKGDVRAAGGVELLASGSLVGDVHSEEGLSMEEGAHFEGHLDAKFDLPKELTEGGSTAKRR